MVNFLFLSPLVWVANAGAALGNEVGPGIYLVSAQIAAAIVLFLSHKAYKKKNESVSSDTSEEKEQ